MMIIPLRLLLHFTVKEMEGQGGYTRMWHSHRFLTLRSLALPPHLLPSPSPSFQTLFLDIYLRREMEAIGWGLPWIILITIQFFLFLNTYRHILKKIQTCVLILVQPLTRWNDCIHITEPPKPSLPIRQKKLIRPRVVVPEVKSCK